MMTDNNGETTATQRQRCGVSSTGIDAEKALEMIQD
jgi:hypothetical protein